MLYEIEKIELKEENGYEFLVLTTKPQSVFEFSLDIVVFNECIVDCYKVYIKKYGSFEKLPPQWRILSNVVYVPVQLKKPILAKNDAFGTEYETPMVSVLCKYYVDDEAVARGELENAVKWAPGWSPEERARWYDNHPIYNACSTTPAV